ncbi:MAG TPA: hypothetical protein VMF08_01850 [Candidatus Sulfotelmatobacter sp.]|nr:hypothetical protein [Candidatus Sulfotelmatobacter sp.]
MNTEVLDYAKRPKRYQNIDGTGEMVVGLTVLGVALAGYLEALLPKNSTTWMRVAVVFASLAVAVCIAYGTRRAIKGYITWPRTGYVAFPRHGKSWWVKAIIVRIIALIFAVGLAYLIKSRHIYLNWNLSPTEWNPRVIILIVVSVAAYPIWIARMGGGYRWKWLVLVFMVLGLTRLAIRAPEDFGQWARPPVLFIAILWLMSGAGTLYSYVRHTKPEIE